MSPGLILPMACLCLFGLGLSSYLVLQAEERERKIQRRFAAALNAHERLRNIDLAPAASLAIPLASSTAAARAARLFGVDRARLELYPTRPWIMIAAMLVLGGGAAYVLGLIVGRLGILMTPVFSVMFSRMLFNRFHSRRRDILFRQFPDALAMIVRAVRVGIPITESIRAVARENEAPTAGEFARLSDQIAIGVPLEEALRGMAERNGLAEYRFFATALSLQSQTGGNLSETLENLADVIRKRVAARARGYALAAEARMSANVLSALPVLLFITLWFMNPGYVSTLLGSKAGHVILGLTLVLLGGGMGVMRMMIRTSLS